MGFEQSPAEIMMYLSCVVAKTPNTGNFIHYLIKFNVVYCDSVTPGLSMGDSF